jgi:hypothetical protein
MTLGGAASADVETFGRTVDLVQAHVRREPGAWLSVCGAVRDDPEGTTRALLALGTVLLDIAAGAFDLTPEQVLDKVAASAAQLGHGDPRLAPRR